MLSSTLNYGLYLPEREEGQTLSRVIGCDRSHDDGCGPYISLSWRKSRWGVSARTGLPRGLATLLPAPARPCPATWRPMLLQQLLLLPGGLEVRLWLGRGRVLPAWLGHMCGATAWAPAHKPWGASASSVCRETPAPAPAACREPPAPAPAKCRGVLRGGQACRGVCLGMKQLPHCAQSV